jgi:hypothetical protein
MNLSEHFTLEEATLSQTAIRRGLDNTPSPETIEVLKRTALQMEKVRALLGKPILVSSWFRSLLVNQAVGSSATSQHIKGEAVDFICPAYGTPYAICKFLMESSILIRYDQLIYEGTWVHISFVSIPGVSPRKEVLTYMLDKSYRKGLYESRT